MSQLTVPWRLAPFLLVAAIAADSARAAPPLVLPPGWMAASIVPPTSGAFFLAAAFTDSYQATETKKAVHLRQDDDGAGKCTVRLCLERQPTDTAAADGAVAFSWWETHRVPCTNLDDALSGAEKVADDSRPSVWANPITTVYTPP